MPWPRGLASVIWNRASRDLEPGVQGFGTGRPGIWNRASGIDHQSRRYGGVHLGESHL